ncbi:MAG: type II toxin-antitoxin system RelE/ParE family toxin [Candidatus Omnitrophota bacterium]
MRKIIFYRTISGSSPAEEFLDSLNSKQAQKVAWVLQLVEDLERVPVQYFKKLEGADDLWEIRTQFGGNTFRILGFFDGANLIVVCHGFVKKTQKTPQEDIKTAQQRKKDYFNRR